MAYFLDSTIAPAKGAPSYNKGGSFRATQKAAPAKGGRTNQFAADCISCGNRVPKGEGSISRDNGVWVTKHLSPAECTA